MAKLFALSDHHFGHQNIIKYCNRQLTAEDARMIGIDHSVSSFELTALMDAKIMVLKHNEVVSDEDIVILGGDIQASAQGREWIHKIIPKLRGRKILIRGNHDHQPEEKFKEMGIESVHDVLVIDNFCFCHYPDHYGVVELCKKNGHTLVCGHTHKPFGRYNDSVTRINMNIDVVGRTPLQLK